MADSESSSDAMEVDLRVTDFSLRSQPCDQQQRFQGVAARPSNSEESIDLSIRPRSCSSSESLDTGYRYRHRWDNGEHTPRDRPGECLRKEVQVNGHINGFSDSSQLDSTDSEMCEVPSMCVRREMSQTERKHHEALMQRLKEELRNEEMKLVLLKKLRQSQSLKESLLVPSSATTAAATTTTSTTAAAPAVAGGMSKMGLGGRHQSSSFMGRHKMLGSPTQSLLIPPMSHNNSLGSRSVNALSANLMLQQSVLRPGLLSSRMPVTTPPNVVIGYHNMLQQNSSGNKPSGSTQISQVSPNTSSPTPQSSVSTLAERGGDAHQTPAQRQAAAKLALRKQLEKTLLQIPPPKPPPPEMHFIPNANNQEFVYLLGLEVVVGFLVGDDQRKKPPPDPFDCVQCCTDFTPVWKWQETSKRRQQQHHLPAVICESCVTTNIKKALKAEHTNRLKTAFVKALQQEQEIEQRMAQGSPPPLCTTPPVTQRASTPPTSHSPVQHVRQDRGSSAAAAASAVAAAVANSAALLQQMPKLSAAHQSLLQAQQLQQLAQSLPQQHHHQPQPAHMLPFGPLLAAQAYSYSMMGKSSLSTSDLQRQYLLDMIPPRSMSQSTMNWKT